MIVVKVELWSAASGKKTELARMMIAHEAVRSKTRRDYSCRTYVGRSLERLQEAMLAGGPISKAGRVDNHANAAEHVWNLVAKCLTAMRYGELHGARLIDLSPTKTPRRSAAEIEAAGAGEPPLTGVEAISALIAGTGKELDEVAEILDLRRLAGETDTDLRDRLAVYMTASPAPAEVEF